MIASSVDWMLSDHFKIVDGKWIYDKETPKSLIDQFEKFFKMIKEKEKTK